MIVNKDNVSEVLALLSLIEGRVMEGNHVELGIERGTTELAPVGGWISKTPNKTMTITIKINGGAVHD